MKSLARRLIEGRDDIDTLPIPNAAKRYARRHGLRAMQRQPEEFWHVNQLLTNPMRKSRKFTNSDEGGPVAHAIKR